MGVPGDCGGVEDGVLGGCFWGGEEICFGEGGAIGEVGTKVKLRFGGSTFVAVAIIGLIKLPSWASIWSGKTISGNVGFTGSVVGTVEVEVLEVGRTLGVGGVVLV